MEKHPHFHESGDSPKGQKYVCKSEILNYGAKYKTTKPASLSETPGAIEYIGTEKDMGVLFKENNIHSVKDAVSRIVLKKGEVIVNENIDKDTGDIDFNYNVE